MTANAITAETVVKVYRVGDSTGPGYRLLRDSIAAGTRRLLGKATAPAPVRTHHALDGVSFAVARGEVLGIIGANGAGKSTLLKILSRVTQPTSGRCRVEGRVAALLEVGTGFNPELTGRENVYVNGAILGMSRHEIRSKFDEIVEFAGVAHYIDTPVKRYSSGMQVRLGFAVAAHLEPEIMLVDEVLAVGDAGFQRRCLGKMNEYAHHGRTVLFVSHNMEAMAGLCSRVIWLDQGRIRMEGDARRVVQAYLAESVIAGRSQANWPAPERRPGSGAFRFQGIRLVDDAGSRVDPALVGGDVSFELDFRAEPQGREHLSLWIWIRSLEGRMVTTFATRMMGQELNGLSAGGTIRCRVPRLPLGPGTYAVTLAATLGAETADQVDQALVFDVAAGDFFGTGIGTGTTLSQDVVFLCDHNWSVASDVVRPTSASAVA